MRLGDIKPRSEPLSSGDPFEESKCTGSPNKRPRRCFQFWGEALDPCQVVCLRPVVPGWGPRCVVPPADCLPNLDVELPAPLSKCLPNLDVELPAPLSKVSASPGRKAAYATVQSGVEAPHLGVHHSLSRQALACLRCTMPVAKHLPPGTDLSTAKPCAL